MQIRKIFYTFAMQNGKSIFYFNKTIKIKFL